MTEPASIVVIDDDAAMRISCHKILTKTGYRVETFENGAQGLEGTARVKPDLLLVDLKMPGLSGTDVITRVHELDPGIVIVVITGYATIDTAVGAMKCGAYDFLPKPFSPDELRLIVARALERRRFMLEAHRAELDRELLKRRFVTFVSHQLQTPLVAVRQYLEVLRRLEGSPDAEAKRSEWYERCLTRVSEMQCLIKDWLTLARLEGCALGKQRVRIDAGAVVAGVVAASEPSAQAAGIRVENHVAEGGLFVAGDPSCFGVLIDNLVSNAIKYNRPSGSVTISGAEADGEVVLSVADTGIGIPQSCRALLFQEFFRVEQPGGKRPGTGLGLAIAKRIVAEMGGTIEVESAEGAGSTFRVRVPAWRETAPEG